MLRTVTLITSTMVLGFTLMTSAAYAACTYNEAVMALQGGNQVRGNALMKMAARDGDQRAVRFLAEYDQQRNQLLSSQEKTGQLKPGYPGKSLKDLLLVLNSSSSAADTSAQN